MKILNIVIIMTLCSLTACAAHRTTLDIENEEVHFANTRMSVLRQGDARGVVDVDPNTGKFNVDSMTIDKEASGNATAIAAIIGTAIAGPVGGVIAGGATAAGEWLKKDDGVQIEEKTIPFIPSPFVAEEE